MYLVDTSNNNEHPINWREVAHNSPKTGITGALLKETEGIHFVDEFAADDRHEAKSWGIRVGLYHFARPDLNPGVNGARNEARFFASNVRKVYPGEIRVMLDMETRPADPFFARAFCQEIKRLLGVGTEFYSYWSFIQDMHLRLPVGDGLDLAWLGPPFGAPVPLPWKHWNIHQYNWHGEVAGIGGQVDLNYAPSLRGILAYANAGMALEPLYAARRRKA